MTATTKTPTAAEKAALDAAAALGATPVDEHDEDIVEAELVPADAPGTGLVLHEDAPIVAEDDWSRVDDGDATPDASITIPLYQMNRKSDGGFLNEDTGETVREIHVVLTNKVNTKAWWPEPFGKGDDAPSCRSDDGITPNIDRSPAQQDGWVMPPKGDGEVPARLCAECPNSQWDGDNPPTCTASIEFLASVITGESALRWARLRFAGMALKVARDYWNSFKLRMPARPPMAFVTSITLEEQVTPNGTFLVPLFRRDREIGFSEARPVLEARAVRQLEWRQAVATDDRQITTGSLDDEDGDPFDERPFTEEPGDRGRTLRPDEEKF